MPVPVTLLSLSSALSDLAGGMLTAAGLDGSPTSRVWIRALTAAGSEVGLVMDDPTTISDADLVLIAPDDVPQLRDVAEFRAVEVALIAFMQPDQRISLGEIKWGGLRAGIEATVARLQARLRSQYGYGLASPHLGQLGSDFAAVERWWGTPFP